MNVNPANGIDNELTIVYYLLAAKRKSCKGRIKTPS